MAVTIREVAAMARVSPGTVSNVLNGRRLQDDAIARAVLDAVRVLGYRVNEAASNLRLSQSRIIGMVVPDLCNPFFARLVDGAQQAARADGHRVFVSSSRECVATEVDEITSFQRWKVAGMIIAPAGDGRRYRHADALGGVPGVILDRVPSRCAFDSVGIDDRSATRLGIDRLVDQGAQRIAVVHQLTDAPNLAVRLAACRTTAKRRGIELLELACPIQSVGQDALTESSDDVDSPPVAVGEARLQALLSARRPPDGVFSLSIVTTRLVLRVLSRHRIRFPDQISLVGFDDSQWLDSVHPGIDAIAQPTRTMAERGWQALQARLLGAATRTVAEQAVRERSSADAVRIKLACQQHWRGSTRRHI